MGIFKKRVSSENIIFDLLKNDIRSFNKDNLEFIGIEENSVGTKYERYRKKLESFELEIFSIMDVFFYSDNEISVFLYCTVQNSDLRKLGSLIDKFYKAYGDDTLNNGQFKSSEINDILLGSFWTGRMWTRIKPEIIFTLKDEEIIELGILGVEV